MKKILCQNCRQKEVEVSFTHIENGRREDYMLCHSCANKLHMQERFAQFLNSSAFEELYGKMAQQNLGRRAAEKRDASKGEQKLPPKKQPTEVSELTVLNSKILALTMDKEAALASENFYEAARIQKVLDSLLQDREQL